MDYGIILFWIICWSCVSGLFVLVTRLRSGAVGWGVVYLAVLMIDVAGWFRKQNEWIYAAAGIWFLLVLVPGLLSRACYQRMLQQHYAAAYRLAKIISWLHPADGWLQQPQIVRALDLAQQGEWAAAQETLARFQNVKSVTCLSAITHLYRVTGRWEELLAWETSHQAELEQHAQLLPVLLRARGETGKLRDLAQLYDWNKVQIAKLAPAASRDLCRLMLFAFGGQRESVARLFSGSLASVPAPVREFWTATVDWSAGAPESARERLERLLPSADPPMRLAIERRLSQLSHPLAPLDSSVQKVVESAALEQHHDDQFGSQRPLFSKDARATQILIVLNVVMFGVEMCFGGSTNSETLYKLGALFGPAVRGGEWWRLLAALFLHLGPLHLAMNMFALWILGPFVEFAFGFLKYLAVYLIAGIGSMGFVMLLAGPDSGQLTVGASGCIMGLVGATAALMLRGWRRQKAMSAKRRLIAVFAIVLTQTVFDSLVPQVSMAAHLSGTVIGFVTAFLLRDRLQPTEPARQASPTQ